MKKPEVRKSLLDGYRVTGFRTKARVKGRFGDPSALVITLSRRQKKRAVEGVAPSIVGTTIGVLGRYEILVPGVGECILSSISGGSSAECVGR